MDVQKLADRLNAPVQGTGADGLKLALALLWERRDECPEAMPVLACHDEVVVECDAQQAGGGGKGLAGEIDARRHRHRSEQHGRGTRTGGGGGPDSQELGRMRLAQCSYAGS